ncbi:hypothetical protein HanHA300_Chr04g0154521 [Helianthus annuus]|nr:hypothetical protein HanHA300_Chr04g0154521 [Helianthus annuus]
MPVGLKQKQNVNTIVQKCFQFLQENFTVILFHYDGKLDGWWDLKWSKKAVHIVANNQTKWWFAKRFLHPASVSLYDYVFLWDEDLGVQHFNPKRVYDSKSSLKCSMASKGPPCAGFVEGMAPVFSKAAWHCVWHLIQNDLVHGWGMDMKLGYCAQGLRNVGIVDSEYVLHQGIQTLGGPSANKLRHSSSLYNISFYDLLLQTSNEVNLAKIRRQSTSELEIFKRRWEKAVKEDKNWVDPFLRRKQAHK